MSKYKITHKKPIYLSQKEEYEALKRVAKTLIKGSIDIKIAS